MGAIDKPLSSKAVLKSVENVYSAVLHLEQLGRKVPGNEGEKVKWYAVSSLFVKLGLGAYEDVFVGLPLGIGNLVNTSKCFGHLFMLVQTFPLSKVYVSLFNQFGDRSLTKLTILVSRIPQ